VTFMLKNNKRQAFKREAEGRAMSDTCHLSLRSPRSFQIEVESCRRLGLAAGMTRPSARKVFCLFFFMKGLLSKIEKKMT
jgi:hypothetical protein